MLSSLWLFWDRSVWDISALLLFMMDYGARKTSVERRGYIPHALATQRASTIVEREDRQDRGVDNLQFGENAVAALFTLPVRWLFFGGCSRALFWKSQWHVMLLFQTCADVCVRACISFSGAIQIPSTVMVENSQQRLARCVRIVARFVRPLTYQFKPPSLCTGSLPFSQFSFSIFLLLVQWELHSSFTPLLHAWFHTLLSPKY